MDAASFAEGKLVSPAVAMVPEESDRESAGPRKYRWHRPFLVILAVEGVRALYDGFLWDSAKFLAVRVWVSAAGDPALTNAVVLMLFVVLYLLCLAFLHFGITHYMRTGELRRFAGPALVAYVLAATYLLLNGYLPDAYCVSRTHARLVFVGLGFTAGLVFGILVYELERATRHELRRSARRRACSDVC